MKDMKNGHRAINTNILNKNVLNQTGLELLSLFQKRVKNVRY